MGCSTCKDLTVISRGEKFRHTDYYCELLRADLHRCIGSWEIEQHPNCPLKPKNIAKKIVAETMAELAL